MNDEAWGRRRRLTSLRPVWEAAKESGRSRSDDSLLGGWLTGELVVRADYDRLQAHDIATGAVRWSWDVPGNNVIEVVSRDTDDGVALVLHHGDGDSRRSRPTLVAVELATGKIMLTRPFPHSDFGYRSMPCVALCHKRIVSIVNGDIEAVNPGDGGELWRCPLPGGDHDAWIVCADPLVVTSRQRGKRGRQQFFVFAENGDRTAEFDLPAPYEEARLPAAVVNGVLAVQLADPEHDRRDKRIGGFDLATGKLRWDYLAGLGVSSLLPNRDRLLVMERFGSRILALDPDDGRVIAGRRLSGWRGGTLYSMLCASGEDFAVLDPRGSDSPLRVFRWR